MRAAFPASALLAAGVFTDIDTAILLAHCIERAEVRAAVAAKLTREVR